MGKRQINPETGKYIPNPSDLNRKKRPTRKLRTPEERKVKMQLGRRSKPPSDSAPIDLLNGRTSRYDILYHSMHLFGSVCRHALRVGQFKRVPERPSSWSITARSTGTPSMSATLL